MWRCRFCVLFRSALGDRVDAFEREVILAELKRSHLERESGCEIAWGWSGVIFIKRQSIWIDLRCHAAGTRFHRVEGGERRGYSCPK